MKLEIGMYVRTKSFKGLPSKIGKINKIEYNAGIDNETYIALDNDEEKCRRWTEDWLIGKPSFNPVDLIEVGDYVNGELVLEKVLYGNNAGVKVFGNIYYIEDIKTIVTHEQMEIMSYIVEG